MLKVFISVHLKDAHIKQYGFFDILPAVTVGFHVVVNRIFINSGGVSYRLEPMEYA